MFSYKSPWVFVRYDMTLLSVIFFLKDCCWSILNWLCKFKSKLRVLVPQRWLIPLGRSLASFDFTSTFFTRQLLQSRRLYRRYFTEMPQHKTKQNKYMERVQISLIDSQSFTNQYATTSWNVPVEWRNVHFNAVAIVYARMMIQENKKDE